MKTQDEILDELSQYYSSETFYPIGFGNKYVYTVGIKKMIELCQCYWLLDIVWSVFHKLKNQDFQVWNITKNKTGSALVSCTDGNDNIIYKQKIPYTDFPLDSYSFYCEKGSTNGVNLVFVIMLKNER